eukprot:TRINITY_DN11456_c0_g1_i3.p1 TRINITY_DN11456_c0_g1~~TRINITY_DN11456_c0_g1_i3.p1  ORF type:complete len:946 (-),score=146.68 TRINITY_DN11456_c0_g1_i3:85-2922(-)
MFEYLIIVTLAVSGDGFVSNRTTRNARDLVTLDVLGDGRNGMVFDLVSDMDKDITIDTHECPPCLCLLDNHDRDNYIHERPSNVKTSTSSTSTTTTSTTTTTTTSTTTSTSTTSTTSTTPSSTTNSKISSTDTQIKNKSPSSCEQAEVGNMCLSESCVMAAGTILTSMDRTVDPCDDFYQFACGGWAQRSQSLNMDRFQAIDKRNQNIIRSILEGAPPQNISEAEEKTRTFYTSCIKEREPIVSDDLVNLQAVLEFAGGWNISGDVNNSMDFDERVFRLQNQLGVSVLFTWGVIAENNSNHIAIVPGGWNEEYLDDSSTYLKLMTGISWMLQEAAKCPPVEYVYDLDLDLSEGEVINETVEVEYEYSYDVESPKYENIFSMLGHVFWPTKTTVEYEYEYEFEHDTNMTMFMEDTLASPDILAADEDDIPQSQTPTPTTETYNTQYIQSDNLNLRKTSRDECINRLQSEIEADTLSNLVDQRLDLEISMRNVLHLEQKLRNLTSSGPDFTEGRLTPVSIKTLEEKYGFLDWNSFLKRSFQIIDHKLDPDVVVLIDEEYLKGVSELVGELSAQKDSLRILRNYMIWRLVATFYPSKYRDEGRRGEQCLKQTEDVFGPVITAMYVRHKTVEASEALVEEVDMMVDTMKDAFSENLKKLTWMTENSQNAAQEKLSGMMDLIGYPEQVLNSTWLNKKYSEVEVTKDYLMNIIAFQSHQRKEGMKLYTKPYERGSWAEMSHGGNIVTVNAFYSPNSNTMIVPIGMLQDPIYWSQPKSLTFGAFGIVVAHEITHAFDDSGINYNSEGMTAQLYDNKTVEAFHKEATCLRDQYSKYSIADSQVDGNTTLGENLADHGGLSMALEAYNQWRLKNKDHRLPALPFDDMQLFFIGYALPWCSRHTDKHTKNQILNDEHAPERFRVLGPLSNSKTFSDTFQCPAGSRMNPVDKCTVW